MPIDLCRDHAGGNNEFKKREPQVEIIGGINDVVEGQTRPVAHGEEFQLGSVSLRAIETPLCASPSPPWTVAKKISPNACH